METPSLLFLFNHTPTEDQRTDARRALGVERFVEPPPEIRDLWQQVPPKLISIEPYLSPIKHWLTGQAQVDDFVLIQGDFGATCLMVRFAFELGLTPLYSTTERRAVEEKQVDGTVRLVHMFRHCRFRNYEI